MKTVTAEQKKDLYEALDALANAVGAPGAIDAVLLITGSVQMRPRNGKLPVVYAHDPNVQAEARKVLFQWLETHARTFVPITEPL